MIINLKSKAYLQLIIVQMIWGGAFIIGQLALTKQPIMTTLLIRNLGVALIFMVLFCCSKSYKWLPIPRAIVVPLLAMGFLNMVLYNLLCYWGLSLSSAISASLLIPTVQPLITVFITRVKSIDRLTKLQYLGLFVGFLGALATLTGDWNLHPSINNMTGNLLLILAALSFSCYSVLSKSVLNYLPAMHTSAYTTLIGCALFVPISFFGEHQWIIKQGTLDFILYMAYLIVLGGVLSYLWWVNGVKHLGPSQAGAITLLMPPFALLLAMMVLHQSITVFQTIGIILSLSGVALSGPVSHGCHENQHKRDKKCIHTKH